MTERKMSGVNTRRRGAPDASNMLGSFSGERQGCGALPQSSRDLCEWSVLWVGYFYNCRQPSGLNFKFGMSLFHNS